MLQATKTATSLVDFTSTSLHFSTFLLAFFYFPPCNSKNIVYIFKNTVMILINTVMIFKNIDMIFIFPSHLLYFWNMQTQKM